MFVRLSLIRRFLMLFIILCVLIAYPWTGWSFGKTITPHHVGEGLVANSSQFSLEGKPFRILGGSVHYFRVPRAHWEDRLLKMKACGLNTLTTYVPWNLHEPERGVFDFLDNLDLEAFLSLAAQLGLRVILRPGPYICAEWELGGLPSWLLRDKHMKLRTTYPGFTEAVESFFQHLMKRVVPYQHSKGGPIIAVQVENEYGSYAKDTQYMSFIKEALLSRGITELLMTSDNKLGRKLGAVNGALETINLQKLDKADIKYLEEIQPGKPKMVMDYWCGWFDLWGSLHHQFPAEDMVAVVTEILQQEMSINLYMFHGGTNFGFMNGAFEIPASKGIVTSYDYDAPLSEAGDYTAKYRLLRNVFSPFHAQPLPEVPYLQKRSAHQPVVILQHLSLWDSLPFAGKPFRSSTPVNMENLPVNNNNGQSYGYTLYETTITSGGTLNSMGHIRDRALVFLNRHFVGVLDYTILELPLLQEKGQRTLSLLVENCGRVSNGKTLDDQRKGLVGDVTLNKKPLRDFMIYSLDMKADFVNRLQSSGHWRSMRHRPAFPEFLQAKLYVDGTPTDTFVKLPGWSKGVIFINGRNLGRYNSIGPQQTLYLPGPWLRRGTNQVTVFEEQEADGKIQFASSPDYGMSVDIQ